ncbi:GNAT family N-acetyltransferase [Vibrio europaeus]|uniref:GNAT family N-acetyltransferase n=1 Tax=Vibrio europaeus TaxID=300876 RepID=A0AAE7AY69_9VIBR|nr:GNAT family N-acetyltransferase [Vibrio europaeus]MDC5806242.1 GNAT family N-acetyltransferase [Vibrio europaeus]MDC5812555.1 GNAT family N-acetyltransferase [Vibrio europaeus]MDC5825671.1 GNAT family N-acetyltransferase [Vibrio europaeus]MDC5831049.1 GNAT family N-acetyltransferase [Vibrio europaeus]MDC5834004.1 GNAT family N-acetyltransferase [Vibrio europaeus]
MKVRKALKQDAGKLLELIALKSEFDRSMKGSNGQISTTIEKIQRTLFGESPFAYALLLEVDEEVLGFALFHYRYSSFSGEPSIWLDDLLIIGSSRSKGYGAALMHSLKVEGEKALASHISWTASPYNTKAHKFYSRLGAEIDRMEGKRPFYRWTL